MSTITPTSDSTTITDCTAFDIGDKVVSLDTGLTGVVAGTNFGDPATVFVQWTPFNSGGVSVLRLRRA